MKTSFGPADDFLVEGVGELEGSVPDEDGWCC
jgi:hypothetical protein